MAFVRKDCKIRDEGVSKVCTFLFTLFFLLFLTHQSLALEPNELIILVNENSPTSKYIAGLYRSYYTQIPESHVLKLSGLVDCSGPTATEADEIISRQDYRQCIAAPVRRYLADANHPDRILGIKAIITTAGIPYRIKDDNFPDAVYPGGSNPGTVGMAESQISAASVESELSCLWYCNNDGNEYDVNGFSAENRAVNPYQGYRASPIDLFERQLPGNKQMNWSIGISLVPGVDPPTMEGTNYWFGTVNRSFNAGDIYLTARLDGPKNRGKSAVFAVRQILERSRRASTTQYGVNPEQVAVLFDDAPSIGANLNCNRTFNLHSDVDYWVYSEQPQPPDAYKARVADDYESAYYQMTGIYPDYTLNVGEMNNNGMCVIFDGRSNCKFTQAELELIAVENPDYADLANLIALVTFGVNGDEYYTSDYLIAGGPGGAPLFNLANGAVFASLESFNAVTMFSDVATKPAPHGKVVDFLSIGGTAGIGHAFEPQCDAVVDTEFLFYNLLADEDNDGKADMCFAEAAFTAISYLSWAEVVIGDPLMRIVYGPGGGSWKRLAGDANNDGKVNFYDIWLIKTRLGGSLNSPDPAAFDRYYDLCDVNIDGVINYADVWLAKGNLGNISQ
ncbi:MAG: dockerin type I domain-containing protein [Planctomycetota bacterium]